MNIRRNLLSMLVLVLTVGSLGTATQAAAQRAPAPEIDTISISPAGPSTPGTDLTITVEGTARGKAYVRIAGAKRSIPLTEIDRGVYEGEYTVSSRDRFSAGTMMRATLTVRGRSVSISNSMSAAAGAPVAAPPPPPPPPPPVQAAPLEIQRFVGTPVARIEPGVDMRFTLVGTPNARVSFVIEGVTDRVAMQEVRPGQYEGDYVVRRRDEFPSTLNIVATIEAGSQRVTQRLNNSVVDVRPPSMRNLTPADGAIVTVSPVVISGTFGGRRGVGVDAASVRIKVGGTDVTGNATVTPQFFTATLDLRPGNYTVEVTARDLAGNAARENWTFTVARAGQAPGPVGVVLPLEITSHVNNTEIRGGPVEIRGRTAPDARVEFQVRAFSRNTGSGAVSAQSDSQSMRANANGFYAFNFQPQYPVPGNRYEVTVNATKGDQRKEIQLVLHQR